MKTQQKSELTPAPKKKNTNWPNNQKSYKHLNFTKTQNNQNSLNK